MLALTANHGVQWADVDGDGALDLALARSRAEATPPMRRNVLPTASAKQSLPIRVVNADDRATCAGAEILVFASGTKRRLATRWVDAGSGYDAQSDMPVHIGLTSHGAGRRRGHGACGLPTGADPDARRRTGRLLRAMANRACLPTLRSARSSLR